MSGASPAVGYGSDASGGGVSLVNIMYNRRLIAKPCGTPAYSGQRVL